MFKGKTLFLSPCSVVVTRVCARLSLRLHPYARVPDLYRGASEEGWVCVCICVWKTSACLHETRNTDGERQTAAAADFSRQSRGRRGQEREDSRERWEYRNPGGGMDGRTDWFKRTEARRLSLDTASYTLFRSEATRRWLRASESEVMRSVCQVV